MLEKTIWTIGHSTHPINEFINLLQVFKIEQLADIRLLPGSNRYPQFNKEALEASLHRNNIRYCHLKELGGRRKPHKDSKNTAWRVAAFKGYADYMETTEFAKAIAVLEETAMAQKTAYMCSEAVWWSCHRSLISDYLKAKGWRVMHIMQKNKVQEHPYTKPAKIINGKLAYSETDLFSAE